MMLRTPVCSYPIIVTHLSFNFLCLLLLYSIYLNGYDLIFILTLKVPKPEILVTELFILSDPIWVVDLRNEPKKPFV